MWIIMHSYLVKEKSQKGEKMTSIGTSFFFFFILFIHGHDSR